MPPCTVTRILLQEWLWASRTVSDEPSMWYVRAISVLVLWSLVTFFTPFLI